MGLEYPCPRPQELLLRSVAPDEQLNALEDFCPDGKLDVVLMEELRFLCRQLAALSVLLCP